VQIINMNNLLIAVKSCERDQNRGYHEIIRQTWGRDLSGEDLRFFMGGSSSNIKDDEIVIESSDPEYDSYSRLSYKTQDIAWYAVTRQYTHVFLCDTDTFVDTTKLMGCGFQNYDYAGKIDRTIRETFPYRAIDREGNVEVYDHCHPWASGGYGYFLSLKAAKLLVVSSPISAWCEDLWVGQVMGANKSIKILHTPAHEYSWHFPQHIFKQQYDPKLRWMERMYEGDRSVEWRAR
jgi:hypothetical protein